MNNRYKLLVEIIDIINSAYLLGKEGQTVTDQKFIIVYSHERERLEVHSFEDGCDERLAFKSVISAVEFAKSDELSKLYKKMLGVE